MFDPLVTAELHKLGATYSFAALVGLVADCDPLTRHIRICLGMSPAETRSSAMHEGGHLATGWFPTGHETPDEYDAMESAADQWAAERLITDAMLSWAQDFARDDRQMAEMLGVDLAILNARLVLAGLAPATASTRLVRSVRVV